MGQAGSRPDAQARRCRDPRQPACPQDVAAREAIDATGARLLFLPPYSPDFNPIENAFAKLKAFLRKAAARTVDDLSHAIGAAIDTFTPAECDNDFAAADYDAY